MEREKTFTGECPAKYTLCSLNGGLRFPFRLFLSLSVAPHRLTVLYDVLPNVSLPCVTNIVLNLPDTFRGESYDETILVDLCKTFPLLYINRFGEDLGPISKVLPTRSIAEKPSDVILSIDDDTIYTSSNIIALCQEHMKDPNCIVSTIAGPNIWNLSLTNVNGFTGVLYPRHLLHDAVVHTMLEYTTKFKACKLHDDMTMTMAFKKHNIRIKGLSAPELPCQVSAGLQDPKALFRITNHYWKHPACAWRIWGLLK